MSKTVLVVDDDPTQRRLIQAVLDREGYAVVHAESGGEAVDRMTGGGGADLILLDLVMPRMTGMECLAELRAAGVTTPVIVLTANAGVDTVVKAMQAGAQDFFVKPVSADRLMVGVTNALQLTRLEAEVGRLTKRAQGRASFDDLVGDGPAMRLVKSLGSRAAKSTIPVLITGESGVGKEVIARALHGASDRAGKPFVAVNCGALFLDEIGELPLDMQVKLLRAIQEGEVDPVGGKRPVKIDVRIISATNRDLSQQVREGVFREDLFYRLNVYPIEAPALRDRREDIPALVDRFIGRFNAEEGKRVAGCAPETLTMLQGFDWPGNVRQLENAVFRAIVLADAPFLQPHDFPAISGLAAPLPVEAPQAPAAPMLSSVELPPLPDSPIRVVDDRGHLRTLEEIERDLIQHAIEVYAGHMSEIARRLGIGRSTLYRKVREQGLEGQLKEAG